MIAMTKNAVALSDVDIEDKVKAIWVLCVLICLCFIFISGLNIFLQFFGLFLILGAGILFILFNPEQKTANRLVCGVLILNCWFIQNACYRTMQPLNFIAQLVIVLVEIGCGVYTYVLPSPAPFLVEIVLASVPLNLVHNLPPNSLPLYVVFYIVYWYVTEAYHILRKKPIEEDFFSRVALIIPLFNLPFVPMAAYYLVVASISAYVTYKKETKTDLILPDLISPLTPEEEIEPPPPPKRDPTPEIKPPTPPPPPKNNIPKFRPFNTPLPKPQPLSPLPAFPAPVPEIKSGGGGTLGDKLKNSYKN